VDVVLAETLPTIRIGNLTQAGLYKTGALRSPGMAVQWTAPILTVSFDGGPVYKIEAAVKLGRAASLTCPTCGHRRRALYLRDGQLACGGCNNAITAGTASRSSNTSPEMLDQITTMILERAVLRQNNAAKPPFSWGFRTNE